MPVKKMTEKYSGKSISKRRLIIVESPAKANTISKLLGHSYAVHASVGHIRDIESKGRGKKAFGIDFENGYEPRYTIIPAKKKNVAVLLKAVAKADEIYLAPDPDREGEAIAWHLKEALELDDRRAMRITYQAVTKKAVTAALGNPRQIDMRLVDAQKGRRVLDRIVGFNLSPFLWKKVAKKLSAGRVQSVAVRMIVEKEREIGAFVPQEYWKIEADLHSTKEDASPFVATLTTWEGENFGLGGKFSSTESEARRVEEALRGADYTVFEVQNKETSSRPAPPFITSTLQQTASSQLRFSIRKTMQVAQKLYEGIEINEGPVGLITYMRTDSHRLDHEAVSEIRNWIAREYPQYLRKSELIYGTKPKGGVKAQDAHEAIRPTSVHRTPELMKSFLSNEQFKLYELIWRRTIASQMQNARYSVTTIKLTAAKGEFEAKGRVTLFDGFTVLAPEIRKVKEEYQDLPSLVKGETLVLDALRNEQNWTNPPYRYNEASLVKALEKQGIGRPSTYAAIIQTIRERGYVRLEKRAFHASELGIAVNDILFKEFPNILNYRFTAEMETNLDAVERGEIDWRELVDNFYKPFAIRVEEAIEKSEPLKGRTWEGEQKCPACGKSLVLRYSKSGAFLGCSGYPKCKGVMSFPGEGDDDGEIDEEPVTCPKCGRLMFLKSNRFGKFYSCSGYPECKTTANLSAEGRPVFLPDIKLDCDECDTPMEVKSKMRGPAMVCPNPDCRRELPIRDGKPVSLPKANGVKCEKCGSAMIVRLSKRGPFLACTGFPKCRNTKKLALQK
ncbi:DNA topoisomerase I [Olavius algarvensis spirochete endosymbiont]|uniref:type I DNA topoisomerase n=1 Tax=Olavius algarvensis spirochete endosymbiont TaxID=260710 RepID=UPI00068A1616|nr:type I DNA topoisomerase [Olavius algarvensis spirochete endosymbiont]VDA99045.1 DNA topoisomerase I [Olavius algarvensis spirochete endosymbiont]